MDKAQLLALADRVDVVNVLLLWIGFSLSRIAASLRAIAGGDDEN